MPPFSYLIQLTLTSENEEKLDDTVMTLKTRLIDGLGEDANIIGPSIPYKFKKTFA